MAAKKTRLTLRGHQSDVDGLAWSPDGKTLATGSNDGVIKLWNPATGKERLTLRGAGVIESIAFTPDGNTLVAAHGDQIVLWDLVPRTSWATYSTNKGFRAVALSQDGRTLAAPPSGERTLKLWDLSSGKERHAGTRKPDRARRWPLPRVAASSPSACMAGRKKT